MITVEQLHRVAERYNDSQYRKNNMLTAQQSSQLTFSFVELLMDTAVNYAALRYLSRFLTAETYWEVVEERVINHLCGYPVCDVTSNLIKPKESLNIRMPSTHVNKYCSKRHYQCSEFYVSQLNSQPLFLRDNVLNKEPFDDKSAERGIILLEEVLEEAKKPHNNAKSMDQVIMGLNNLELQDKEKSMSQMVDLLRDFVIHENTDPQPEISPTFVDNSIEGYASRR